MNDMNLGYAGQAPADRLRERRRRTPRGTAPQLSPEGVRLAQQAAARIERGDFDDAALARAVAAATLAS